MSHMMTKTVLHRVTESARLLKLINLSGHKGHQGSKDGLTVGHRMFLDTGGTPYNPKLPQAEQIAPPGMHMDGV